MFQAASPNFAISLDNLVKGMADELVQKYAAYMENAAIKLGSFGNDTKKELQEVLQFEISLAKVRKRNAWVY